MQIDIIQKIPSKFFSLDAKDLWQIFKKPTLLKINGSTNATIFVSVLLHGDETSGFYAIQKLLSNVNNLEKNLWIFFGNIEAARYEKRFLDHQLDFNRIWSRPGESPYHKMAENVLDVIKNQKLFAAVDIHNNSGRNPIFACIHDLENLSLAKLFSKYVVYFTNPDTTLSIAMTKTCPSLVLECGKIGNQFGQEDAYNYLLKLLKLLTIPKMNSQKLEYHKVISKIKIPKSVSLEKDLILEDNLDLYNFKLVEKNTVFATLNDSKATFEIEGYSNNKFFKYNSQIKSANQFIPSMLTLNTDAIQKDCLGYIMKKKLYKS